MSTAAPDAARCRGCGYPLRELATPRCPECGRAFDPADVTTMDLGRRPGVVGRLLLRPTGWFTAGIAVIAAAIVMSATRWPVGKLKFASADWLYYFADRRLDRDRLLSFTDWAYVTGLLVSVAVLTVWLVRAAARLPARRFYGRPTPSTGVSRRLALATIAAGALSAAGGVMVGWPYRIARIWARNKLTSLKTLAWGGWAHPPTVLSDAEAIDVLRTGLARLTDPRERMACLRLLYDQYPATRALSVVMDQLARERDPAMRLTLIHLAGLHRNASTVKRLLQLWDDSDTDVRAAAIEAVGMVRTFPYPITATRNYSPTASLQTDPPLHIASVRKNESWTIPGDEKTPVNAELDPLRPQFVARMLGGVTDAERQAAARALLRWQPAGYQLRIAEWGVWIADSKSNLLLLQSVLDEIPPFVHRTGDSLDSLNDRLNVEYVGDVTKPILHVTVDRPMVLDVQVMIAGGRPWFAYPRPDDFTVTSAFTGQTSAPQGAKPPAGPAAKFDRPGWPKLMGREGYPWIDPPHRLLYKTAETHGWGRVPPSRIESAGLRWQSVIAAPEQLPWMNPHAVPRDPRFAWWERLRQVDGCAWLSSSGEAERFLYYDGPTTLAAPVIIQLEAGILRTRASSPPPPNDDRRQGPWSAGHQSDQSFEPMATPAHGGRAGMLIDVWGGAARGLKVDEVPGETKLPASFPLAGEPAIAAAIHALLTTAGLTAAEAAGLIDCWRPQWFHTEGSRFLLLLAAADYDALCPIRIDPVPTELVRVGIVMTELSDGHPAGG